MGTPTVDTAVHRRERRAIHPGLPLRLDVVGDPPQVGRGADDDAHRHVDVEDLAQQVGKCQRRQRVSTQVAEVRIGPEAAGRRAQQRGHNSEREHCRARKDRLAVR
jgi:hypothetical protein